TGGRALTGWLAINCARALTVSSFTIILYQTTSAFEENENAPYSSPRLLRASGRISVGPGWGRWEIEAFCLQLVPYFLNAAIELLIFTFKFFCGIIIDDDIRINSVTFDDPLFAVLGINRELRFEELPAVDKRQRLANAGYAAPRPFADEFAEPKRFKSIRKNIAIGGGEFVDQCYHRTGECL